MKIISHKDISALNMKASDLYRWAEYVITHKAEAILPPKISIKPQPGVFCNVMPCYFGNAGGVKMVTRYPDREPSLDSQLLLLDTNTGKTVALMDANYITALRTAAVCVHSLLLFAKTDFQTVGFMGLGNVARATMFILLDRIGDRPLTVKLLKYKDQHDLFMQRFSGHKNIKFILCDTPAELVTDSDVIVSAVTYMGEDACGDECFKKGVTVIPVHTLGFTNCDLFFDKVFADDYGHVKNFKYFDKFRRFAEVSDVVNGSVVGRADDSERILVYNIGIALHDIYFASKIYELAKDNCPSIELEPPHEKFWI